MDINSLEKKWSKIGANTVLNYKAVRISKTCIPDLFIGYSQESNRSLILSLPGKTKVDIRNDIKRYISLQYFNKSHHIIIQLLDSSYNDLFNDFILSIYKKIWDIESPNEAINTFVNIYSKWSNFFNENKEYKLNDEELQGLFGELFYLQKLLINARSVDLANILRGWTGPYDKGHDFTLDSKDIEIKTKIHAQTFVEISSEFQMQPEIGKGLDLVVISIEKNTEQAITIGQLVNRIKDIIISKMGELPIFLNAINKKNLTLKNLSEYDYLRFEVIKEVTYNTFLEGFPRLIRTNIPPEIGKLKYYLSLPTLTKYIIKQ